MIDNVWLELVSESSKNRLVRDKLELTCKKVNKEMSMYVIRNRETGKYLKRGVEGAVHQEVEHPWQTRLIYTTEERAYKRLNNRKSKDVIERNNNPYERRWDEFMEVVRVSISYRIEE